jgi:hypothetical protein
LDCSFIKNLERDHLNAQRLTLNVQLKSAATS